MKTLSDEQITQAIRDLGIGCCASLGAAFKEGVRWAERMSAAQSHDPNAKLMELADRIDYEKLWGRPGLEQFDWPQDKRDRMMAGVMLRRYADLLGNDGWRLYPPHPGTSFRATTLDDVVDMARAEERRRNA